MTKKTAALYNLLPEITDQHIAILGKTGSGKTFTAKGYVETLIRDGRRVCIFDPTGVWWGLRYTRAPAMKPGLRVPIVGGLAGDIEDADPAALGRHIGRGQGAIIVDVSEMMIGDRHKFAEHFFASLYQANRQPLYLIIDEADEVAPQNPLPETRRMLHQVDRVVRRGRTRGFVVTLISQRPAVLHKNVLSQANTLIAMQLTSSQDRKAVEAWIKGQADVETGKRVLADLPKLKQGTGYVWSPQYDLLERARFPAITTADTSATPKHDEVALEPPDPPSYAGEFPELAALEADAPDDAPVRGRGRAAAAKFRAIVDDKAAEKIETAKVAAFQEGRGRGRGWGRGRGRR